MKLFKKKEKKKIEIVENEIKRENVITFNRNMEKTLEIIRDSNVILALDTHIGTREYQQDALYACVLSNGMYAGVLCDGMGGMENGKEASEGVVEFVVNRLEVMTEETNIPEFLMETAKSANDLVEKGSGTTLVCAVIAGNNLYWVSVGDSRIYIIRGEEMEQVTVDHIYELKLMQRVQSGSLSLEAAMSDPQRNSLLSYIGAPHLEYVDVNLNPFKLTQGDIVLLCSDGLTKSLSDQEILKIVRRHGDNLVEASRVLPLSAFDASPNGQDNTSVILMQYIKNVKERD